MHVEVKKEGDAIIKAGAIIGTNMVFTLIMFIMMLIYIYRQNSSHQTIIKMLLKKGPYHNSVDIPSVRS